MQTCGPKKSVVLLNHRQDKVSDSGHILVLIDYIYQAFLPHFGNQA